MTVPRDGYEKILSGMRLSLNATCNQNEEEVTPMASAQSQTPPPQKVLEAFKNPITNHNAKSIGAIMNEVNSDLPPRQLEPGRIYRCTRDREHPENVGSLFLSVVEFEGEKAYASLTSGFIYRPNHSDRFLPVNRVTLVP